MQTVTIQMNRHTNQPDERDWSEWEGPILVRTGLADVADMFADTDEEIPQGPN